MKVKTSDLKVKINPSYIDFSSTSELEPISGIISQDEALKALEVGISIEKKGFNIYVAGENGTGRTSAVKNFLKEIAKKKTTPDDICYAHNFEDSYSPFYVMLPPGKAKEFNTSMEKIVKQLETNIPLVFDDEKYREKIKVLDSEFRKKKDKILLSAENAIKERGFLITQTQSGLIPVPIKNGKRLTDEDIIKMSNEEKEELLRKKAEVDEILSLALRKSRKIDFEFKEKLEKLDYKFIKKEVNEIFKPLVRKFKKYERMEKLLSLMKENIVENYRVFTKEFKEKNQEIADEFIERYFLNIIVDNSETDGAPVVIENNPSYTNLIGKIERESIMGALVTDFSLIKAGSILKSNGGYLIINAEDLLMHPQAWNSLKKSLSSEKVYVENLEEKLGYTTAKSVKPEPIPIKLKVILIGTRETYEILSIADPSFKEIFKIKAEFQSSTRITKKSLKEFARFFSYISKKDSILPLRKDGFLKIVEYASRISGNNKKISANFGLITEIIKEADYYARESGKSEITEEDIKKSIVGRIEREKFFQKRLIELVEDGTLKFEPEGLKVGEIYGLTVISTGTYEFGFPVKITASSGAGKEGVINIEREAELSGPFHTKGVLILSGFLTERFGKDFPINISSRIVFEQNYTVVDGDSASAAELIALLSSLSGVRIKQNFSITGSVNQKGEIQAIGGVNEKIEGFFEAVKIKRVKNCSVVIPESNVKNLNLSDDVISAVKKGEFAVYSVSTVEEAIDLIMEKNSKEVFREVKKTLKKYYELFENNE